MITEESIKSMVSGLDDLPGDEPKDVYIITDVGFATAVTTTSPTDNATLEVTKLLVNSMIDEDLLQVRNEIDELLPSANKE